MKYEGMCYITFNEYVHQYTYGFEVTITDKDIDDGAIYLMEDDNWYSNTGETYLMLHPDILEDIMSDISVFYDESKLFENNTLSDKMFSLGFLLYLNDRKLAEKIILEFRKSFREHFGSNDIGEIKCINYDISKLSNKRILHLLKNGQPI